MAYNDNETRDPHLNLKLANRLSKILDDATEISEQLAVYLERLSDQSAEAVEDRPRQSATKYLKEAAMHGISKWRLTSSRRHYWKAFLDDLPEVELPEGLARLLEILAEDDPSVSSADGLIMYKSYEAIRDRLQHDDPTAEPLSRHALTERIRRLRKLLDKARVNKYLIQGKTNEYRLALRR